MAPHESTLVSWKVLARRSVSTVQVTDVSPRDGLQNETAQASTAAAARQPTTGDDGTALGLQYFPACGRVQAFGHVKELAGVQGADQMPLLGEPEIPVDGAPSRLPSCHGALVSSLARLARQLLKLVWARVRAANWKLQGSWSHEMLLNFYTRHPRLYVHKDLSALTLLLCCGSGRLFLPAQGQLRHGRAVLLVGTRFQEAFPSAKFHAPQPHGVQPAGPSGPSARPRLSVALFLCRERVESRAEVKVDTPTKLELIRRLVDAGIRAWAGM
ncbi:unnamed protein product [Effrenium voratum]|nr:unnamed protein product [Effrenium voratum]